MRALRAMLPCTPATLVALRAEAVSTFCCTQRTARCLGKAKCKCSVQAVVLLPLFGFCALMWRWERASVVSSRFTGAADGRPESVNESPAPSPTAQNGS